MIDTLKQLIAIPSVSQTKYTKDALRYVLALCESFGFSVHDGGSYGYAQIGQGEEMMGIIGHLDVVPAGQGWDSDPFTATIKEGQIIGRGVMDDKGPMMVAIYAMKDVYESDKHLNKRVRIIFGTCEEVGEWEDIEAYKANEELPTFGFTPDADFPAIYGEKGLLQTEWHMPLKHSGFQSIEGGEAINMVPAWAKGQLDDGTWLEAKGKSAHGSMPKEGINAISKLMEQAHGPLAAFYRDKIDMQGAKLHLDLADEQSGSLTLNVGKVEVRGKDVVLSVDIRYPVSYTEADVLTLLKQEVEPDMHIVRISGKAPIYMDKNGPIITKMLEAYRTVTHDDSDPLVIGGGTYARAMDHIIAFGPVFPGVELTEHQANERIDIADLEKAREIYRLAIEKLATD
ncbi:MAG: Sapep family Mn(2+)-dependent dipeptidase [Absicoccus sp.]|uniref:Sapep family Mn(2+)-dependent dipeptidase n=1 Tax=Absicoccus sp. TaxID=2718527 RepID=UPI002A74CA94|nr:Sapep family Mn(2+)-dependent dipeptidase [Absicoccus sp.]MDY3036349.1 Sapep family Mn(2+)-dependent dipeptidase [Absicoccus sp.]